MHREFSNCEDFRKEPNAMVAQKFQSYLELFSG
jgi:hypothetical protein